MSSREKLFMLVLLVPASLGCGIGPFSRPAGTIRQQQFAATLYDPYPSNDIAPEVVGGRPRDYQEPRAEAVRNTAHPATIFRGLRN